MVFHENLTDDERKKCCWIVDNINNFYIEDGENRLCIYFDKTIIIYHDGNIVPIKKAKKKPVLKKLCDIYDSCVDYCGEEPKPGKENEVNFLKAYLYVEYLVQQIDDLEFVPDVHYHLVHIPEGME
jgi:hypothetical protein